MANAERKATKDLTHGTPWKLILSFTVPLIFGLLFQQFYNMVDSMIVGRMLGASALAAVGSTGSINFMIIGFCMGICNGFAIPVAQRFGAGDERGLRRYVGNAAVLSVIFAAVITTTVCLLCRQILEWMNTPSDIIDMAYSYIFIIFLGIPVIFLYNQTAGIIRSLGDSRSPLYFLGISSVLNVMLDLLLVRPLGVAGTAVATVTSQGISGVLCLIYMSRKFDILHLNREDLHLRKQYVLNLCNMGIPMGLQYSITAIGSVVLQTAVNGLGTIAVASMTAASKVSIFFSSPTDTLGSAMATYAGQNVGAKRMDRVNTGMKSSLLMGSIYSVGAFLLMYLIGERVTLLFVDASETEILANAREFLMITSAFYVALVFVNVVRFTIQGMGFSRLAVLAGVCEMVARALVGFALVPLFGYRAACFAGPIAWIMADLFLVPAYRHVLKKLQHFYEEEKIRERKVACAKN